MNNSTAVSTVALGIGLVALVVIFSNRVVSVEAVPSLAEVPQADNQLLAQIEKVREENQELRDRLAMLESRKVSTGTSRTPALEAYVTETQFAEFRDEVREALSKRASTLTVDTVQPALFESDDFKAKLASTMSDIRKKEAVTKIRGDLEKSTERIDESMPKIEAWLGLSSFQSDEMRVALLAQYDRSAELVRRWEAGEADEVLGEVKRTNRETHIEELSLFLTEEQLETYSNRAGK